MFGGLRAVSGDREITRFQTHKTAALLAYLALRIDRNVARDELVDLLWPDSDPEAGRASLRAALSSLRRQLEPPSVTSGAVLQAGRSAISLNSHAIVTDVQQFELDLDRATKADDRASRVASLVSAVDRYRADLLPDFYDDFISVERDRLAGCFLDAIRRLVRDLTAMGEFERAVRFARRGVAADSLREEAYRDLMAVLVKAGQPSAALHEYESLERLLAQELKARPSSATRELAQRIAQSLGHGLASHAEATASEFREQGIGEDVSEPPAARLPVPLTRFFGREPELTALSQWLQAGVRNRLITLTGAGGSGKTRLSIEAANRVAPSFEGNVWFISLADLTDARLIPAAIMAATRRSPPTGVEPVAALEQFLGELPGCLLILDNFEHLVNVGSSAMERLLARVPMLTCLVTSRRKLGLPGERELCIGPLEVPQTDENPSALADFSSVQLFVDRAQSARPDFQITSRNAAAVAGICRMLEGIPLAIELAAARAQALTPAQMLERLDHKFELLVSRRGDKTSRHRSLWAAIEWSFELLTPEQKRLFAMVSIFRGSFTVGAVESICELPAASEYLAQLRERSLIAYHESPFEVRFRMLESLREFATEQLEQRDDMNEIAHRHAQFYRDLAVQSEIEAKRKDSGVWMYRLETDLDNIRAALDFLETDSPPEALNAAAAMWRFWCVRGHITEGRSRIEALLGKARNSADVMKAHALTSAGIMAAAGADLSASTAYYQSALELRRRIGDPKGIGAVLSNLGVNAFDEGEWEKARAYYEEALSLHRPIGDDFGIAVCLNNLGNAYIEIGDLPAARNCLIECMEVRRKIGDERGLAGALNNLGRVALAEDDPDEAERLQHQSLELYEALGDKPGMAFARGALAMIAIRRGDLQEARELFGQGLKYWAEVDDRREIAYVLELQSELEATENKPGRAVIMLAAADFLNKTTGRLRVLGGNPTALRLLQSLRNELSDPEFTQLYSAGLSMSASEAAEFALNASQNSQR